MNSKQKFHMKNQSFISAVFGSAAVIFLSAASVIQASGLVPCGGPGEKSCTICDFFEMSQRALSYLMFGVIPGLAALILVMGGGYLLWTKGDPTAYNRAKSIMKVSLYGFIIIFSGWLFVNTFFMAFGVLDFEGFSLRQTWWKVNAKCSSPPPPVTGCNDNHLENDEQCDPSAPDSEYAAKYGWSKDMIALVKSKCSATTCTAEWCGDGKVTGDEKCDPEETKEACITRLKAGGDSKAEETCGKIIDKHLCKSDCTLLPSEPCASDAQKALIGEGCWPDNSSGGNGCRRGKYICDPDTNKVVCKLIEPPVNDECCLDGGKNLSTGSFKIVRGQAISSATCTVVCQYLSGTNCSEACSGQPASGGIDCSKLCAKIKGVWAGASCQQFCAMYAGMTGGSFTCDKVCAKSGMVCIGVGLTNVAKNKCIYIVHHEGGNCDPSGNQASNNCRATYTISGALCCEPETCKDEYKPCCSNVGSSGVQFSVGETACYCR